ncbi:MAG: M50 family metallopeptidase [Maioricimonas sp. JB045]
MPPVDSPTGVGYRQSMPDVPSHRTPEQTPADWPRYLLAFTILPLCWLGMQAVHELGHVLAAVLTGGKVAHVVLHPLTISRTDLAINPSPLITAWAGPLVGTVLPVIAWLVVRRIAPGSAHLARFFAGFCLIANGAYLAAGSLSRIGDSGEILRQGGNVWSQWMFAVATVPLGFRLWHGLGPRFGFSEQPDNVTATTAVSCAVALLVVVTVELLCSA